MSAEPLSEEELEERRGTWIDDDFADRLFATCDALRAESKGVAELEAALCFYADPKNQEDEDDIGGVCSVSVPACDGGGKAREVLNGGTAALDKIKRIALEEMLVEIRVFADEALKWNLDRLDSMDKSDDLRGYVNGAISTYRDIIFWVSERAAKLLEPKVAKKTGDSKC